MLYWTQKTDCTRVGDILVYLCDWMLFFQWNCFFLSEQRTFYYRTPSISCINCTLWCLLHCRILFNTSLGVDVNEATERYVSPAVDGTCRLTDCHSAALSSSHQHTLVPRWGGAEDDESRGRVYICYFVSILCTALPVAMPSEKKTLSLQILSITVILLIDATYSSAW